MQIFPEDIIWLWSDFFVFTLCTSWLYRYKWHSGVVELVAFDIAIKNLAVTIQNNFVYLLLPALCI